MKLVEIRTRLKPWLLPGAMLFGVLAHRLIDTVAFLAPWLIFVMLLITFCRIKPRELRLTALQWQLLAVQLLMSVALYFAIRPLSVDVAQGVFICIFCPTATAAPVITGMLGGSVSRLVTYSLVSNIAAAATAPLLFSMMGATDIDFLASVHTIAMRVVPLIVAPLVLAFVLRGVAPKVHRVIGEHQSISFYVWAVSLFIVVGRAVSFIMQEPTDKIPEMVILALASLVACLIQFGLGRVIGRRHGDRIAGAQGLGQKNTVLAIWMALTWLNPIASVAPAAYVAWQNIINSMQIYYKQKQERHHKDVAVGNKA